MKIQVVPDWAPKKALTYEAPDTVVREGQRVRLPLPWFLDNSSGHLDYPGGAGGTVVALTSDYDGPCVAVLGVEP